MLNVFGFFANVKASQHLVVNFNDRVIDSLLDLLHGSPFCLLLPPIERCIERGVSLIGPEVVVGERLTHGQLEVVFPKLNQKLHEVLVAIAECDVEHQQDVVCQVFVTLLNKFLYHLDSLQEEVHRLAILLTFERATPYQ